MKNRIIQSITVAIMTMFAAASVHASASSDGDSFGFDKMSGSSQGTSGDNKKFGGSTQNSTAGENGSSVNGSFEDSNSNSTKGMSKKKEKADTVVQQKEDLDIYDSTGDITHTLFARIESVRANDLVGSEMTNEEVIAYFIATSETEL